MSAKKKKWISIMIVPEDGTGMKKWRITTRRLSLLKAAFCSMCFFLFVGFISLVLLAVMLGKLQQYKLLNGQLLEATSKLHTIAARLEEYEEKESKLRAILGSDLDIPKPMVVKAEPDRIQTSLVATARGLDELDRAIAEEEAKGRKIPTLWPVNAWQISKEFSYTGDSRSDHTGIDLLAPARTIVVAAAEGKIIYADRDRQFGLMVIVDHENGFKTKYGHNASLMVQYGDFVRKGQQIAVFGGSGESSTGSHLHFEMLYKDQPVNPLIYLDEKPLLKLTKMNK